MAISIIAQPAIDSLVVAYRPVVFSMIANQQPLNGNPCPVIIADVYFDGVYYSSISVTDYEIASYWIIVFYTYTFDIQDKVQEYLNSKFARMYEQTKGDMEDVTKENFSCRIEVQFREGFIDADGFTQFYGTAPIQGTKWTAPVAGSGTVSSNTFYGLNATLTHEDNMNFGAHLMSYQDPFQATYGLSHRPNIMPSINKRIGDAQYFIHKEDNDFLFCFSNGYDSLDWSVYVKVKYKNNVVFSSPIIPFITTSTTADKFKVYSFNAGIPNLKTLFATVNWNDVIEYEVFVFAPFFQAMRQYYYVNQCGCSEERTRIFFLNNLGAFDGINFESKQEINKASAELWQSSTPTIYSGSKSTPSINRKQAKQNDYYEVQCRCYYEKDMNWIKELLGAPIAYLQWDGMQGQRPGLIPIVIEDSEVFTLKNNDRQEYVITVKYSMSNERINIRN